MAKNSKKSSTDRPLMGHWGETAKDKPLAAAAAAAGAVAAGVFLWSKRNQIGDQISRLSDQISDWAQDMQSGSSSREPAMTEGTDESSAIQASRATSSRRGAGSARKSSAGGRTAKARRTAGRAEPQSTVM